MCSSTVRPLEQLVNDLLRLGVAQVERDGALPAVEGLDVRVKAVRHVPPAAGVTALRALDLHDISAV